MQELHDYVSQARAAGHTDEIITSELKAAGWSDDQIKTALAAGPVVLTTNPTSTKPSFDTKFLEFVGKYKIAILSVVGVIVLALIGLRTYSYFTNDPEKIWLDTSQKMQNLTTAHYAFDASYTETPPKDKSSSDSIFSFFGSGPIKVSLSGDGDILIKPKLQDSSYTMNTKVSYGFGSLNISIGFESRKVGDYIYYKTDTSLLGDIFGGGSSNANKPAWAKYNIKSAESPLDNTEQTQLIEAFKKAKLMHPTKLLGSETIEGVSTWHYQADLDKQEIKNYLHEVAEISGTPKDQMLDVDQLVDKINFKKLELWIGKVDHLIHQADIEVNSPSILQLSTGTAENKARDARRIADLRQLEAALELFYNDNGRYPTATNNQPTSTDGSKKNQFKDYMLFYPVAPTPADGSCTESNNKYIYEQLDGGKNYKITACIGSDAGGYKAGVLEVGPQGIKTVIPGTSAPSDPLKDVPLNGLIAIKLNLSNFGSPVRIDAPKDAADLTSSSRDAIRLSNARQMQTAFELFYNDNGRYPTATNNQPNLNDGIAPNKLSTYLASVPQAPTPPDGSCTESNNKYTYQQKDNGKDYALTFCIGSPVSGFKAGVLEASSSGIVNK